MIPGLAFGTLRRRGLAYWLSAAFAIALGIYITHQLDDNSVWLKARYWAYQRLQNLSAVQPDPQRTRIVFIDDKEYWKGPLARRVPINRSYLAKVIRALDTCDPSVIALDFDLRSPLTNGELVDNPEYSTETRDLIAAAREVSQHRAVVMPATFGYSPDGNVLLESAVYGAQLPPKGQLHQGYIQLFDDVRKIPLTLTLADGSTLDSFAGAITRAVAEPHLKQLEKSNLLSFGTFIAPDRFTSIPASKLWEASIDEACAPIRHNIAIVGARWHRSAFDEGDFIDLHETPTGSESGVFVQANYVEALLSSRTLTPIKKTYSLIIDILLSSVLAICLGITTNRLYTKFLIVALPCIAAFAISYFAWQNLGLFFEAFFPMALLLAHSSLHYLYELHRDAMLYRKLQQQSGIGDPGMKDRPTKGGKSFPLKEQEKSRKTSKPSPNTPNPGNTSGPPDKEWTTGKKHPKGDPK
ncbi:MAG TPA: CHASE2 domain-containing protein [Thermoanaerobaculia bacterium]